MINPHGGKLINKILNFEKKQEILKRESSFQRIILNKDQIKDVKNISRGVYSPLTGFLKKEDFEKVVKEMRLESGIVWSIPIVLDISEQERNDIKNDKDILLYDQKNNLVAILKNIEIFSYNKDFFVENVFGTLDKEHPGVEAVYSMKDYLIGGEIWLIDNSKEIFPEHNFSPQETRDIFNKNGWKTISAFQTRNVPHCGHEFIQKQALKETDGLLIQPVIGEKKISDFKDEYIIASYEILIDKYYPKNKTFLGILPLKMRYAGPREAIFHAIIRKNFGCTHFIVGRDHAGVGNYYSPFASQEIFDQFSKDEIGIQILKYREVTYCDLNKKHTFLNDCPEENRISFSGTKLRNFIENKKQPPEYILRSEIYNLLINSSNSLVDNMYKNNNKNQKGFVLWFTGLSQSGKTTTADRVYQKLSERGYKVERLDGDLVREHLSKDLGFSKEDRNENIKRVSFLSKLLSRNNVGVLASFISPYKSERDGVRQETENFIEVFCNCSLEECEQRDQKGLYQKARKGEIKNFTGISDPYELPENPEIELLTNGDFIESNTDKIIKYLEENKYI
ncbi:MAG: sulfate adenylyltransferase [Candidatus Nealsonbacteria bacterium]